jgi:hypothetical protein
MKSLGLAEENNMGLFGGDSQTTRNYGDKITDLKAKITQLEKGGMMASAARLRKDLEKLEKPTVEKVKPMSVKEVKGQLKSASGAR